MQISEAQDNAAGEFVELIAARVGRERAIHPQTAIACAARLAGSLLLRSFNLNIAGVEPGSVILSNEANEKGPDLINVAGSMLDSMGVSLDREKLGQAPSEGGEQPRLTVEQSLALLQDEALAIAKQNGLNLEQAAHAAAMATAFIVKESARSVSAEDGFNLAIYGFIEGSKTVPPPAGGGAQPPPAGKKKP